MRKNYFVIFFLFISINFVLIADNSLLKLNLREVANDFISESTIKYPEIKNVFIINSQKEYSYLFLEESLKKQALLKEINIKENSH